MADDDGTEPQQPLDPRQSQPRRESPMPSAPQPIAPPMYPSRPTTPPPGYASQSFSSPPTPPPTKSRAGLVVAGLVAFIAVGIGALVVLFGGGDDTAAPATTVPVATTAPRDNAEVTTTTAETTDSTESETTQPLDAGDATVAELARSTVQVLLLSNGTPVCTGSGTFVDAEGTILTNAHVIDPSGGCGYDTIGISITDDAGAPPELAYSALVFAVDDVLDLAVLRITSTIEGDEVAETFPAVPIGDSDQVQIGDQIRILGYPGIGGETVTFTTGAVSGFTSQANVGERSWIKTDATIAGGNSGGAAFDSVGRLIGVPTLASASDDGPIVDCRIITDTNGDGLRNNQDQCVPIGGFLNGIRPVNLAADLLVQARNADPIGIDSVVEPDPTGYDPNAVRIFDSAWSLGVSEDASVPTEFVVTASSRDTSICIWFGWSGIPNGVEWDGIWLVDGEIDEGYSFFGESWDLGNSGDDSWLCAIDENGLRPGVYEFTFYLEQEIIFYDSIRVAEEPLEIFEVTFRNDLAVPACFVFVAPLGAIDTGLDELGAEEIIDPGGSVVLQIPAGRVIYDVYDCDFDLLIADYDGFLVDADLTIPIN